MYTDEQRRFLLGVARRAIGYYLAMGERFVLADGEVDEVFRVERGVFVTLTLAGVLRGCIGHIEPIQAVYRDVIENAVHAAFHDVRFSSLSEEEFDLVHIEISVLSLPEKLLYSGVEDLLVQLKPAVHGVIIRLGEASATFLPQVWEELPEKDLFLSHLCVKAGLSSRAWRDSDLEVEVYTVECFGEK